MLETTKRYYLPGLKHLHSGKVREIYDFQNDKLLIITTDRISAFDVIMQEEVPGKGKILNDLANFWFNRFAGLIPNQLISTQPEVDFAELAPHKDLLHGRSVVVKKCRPLPIEAIVRGYLTGSGLKEYKKSQTVCKIDLPAGLTEASKLPEPLFTPSTKAAIGAHDENISFEEMCTIIGRELAEKVKKISLKLYTEAAEYALTKGIIIADTKFEFGIFNDELILIDEALTADSSRFWPAADYKVGVAQKSFDKQFLRDYLEDLVTKGLWDKNPPAPILPKEVLEVTALKYQEVLNLLTK